VLGVRGNVCQVFRWFVLFFISDAFYSVCSRDLLTNNYNNMEACIVLLIQKCRSLDDLQHSLMHVQYCMRLSTLLTVDEGKIEKDISFHFNELKTSARYWATIKFVRFVYLFYQKGALNHCTGESPLIACWRAERKSPECVGRRQT
jgi:hypothetical protein